MTGTGPSCPRGRPQMPSSASIGASVVPTRETRRVGEMTDDGKGKLGLGPGGPLPPIDLLQALENHLQDAASEGCLLQQIEQLREYLYNLSPVKDMPIDRVRWVHIDRVTPNDYNPNSVARIEMNLLYV